jgi:hypothetical protein
MVGLLVVMDYHMYGLLLSQVKIWQAFALRWCNSRREMHLPTSKINEEICHAL